VNRSPQGPRCTIRRPVGDYDKRSGLLGWPLGQRLLAASRICEVRAYLAPGKIGAATPTAFHRRPSWAPDEIECRVLLKLPNTNPSPTLATSLRHTIAAERQNRVVVLLKVNVLAAAQTDGHVSGASRTARVIEQPMFGRGFLQLFHFTAGLERKPAFPSRWRAQDQLAEASEGYGCAPYAILPRFHAPGLDPDRRDIGRPPHSSLRAERRADFFPRRLQIFDQNELYVLFFENVRLATCFRLRLAVSRTPQRQPQGIRRPRRSTWRETAGRCGHIVSARVSSSP
jgi:hypothetical protein